MRTVLRMVMMTEGDMKKKISKSGYEEKETGYGKE